MNLLKSLLGGGGSSSSVDSDGAKALIDSAKPPFILDVRQPEEYLAGHISGATLIPLGELSRRMDDVPKDAEILCVCASGGRSSAAVSQLTQVGYQAINLRGGMAGWQSAGYPVKNGK